MLNLRHACSGRHDGYWELLATAAGVEHSVSKTVGGLTAEELGRGVDGQSVAPSLVRERVEALAAYDPSFLRRLSQQWRAPREIAGDPFWTAAWQESLRHLHRLGVVTRSDVAAPELEPEIALLWRSAPPRPVSWRAITAEYKGRVLPYSLIRSWADAPLSEGTLTAEDVEHAPALLLRLLRGKAALLDTSARDSITARARRALEQDPFEAALVAEISRDVQPDIMSSMRSELSGRLGSVSDAREVIPLAYVLLSPDWLVP